MCSTLGVVAVGYLLSRRSTSAMLSSRCFRSLTAALVQRGPSGNVLRGHAGFKTHSRTAWGYMMRCPMPLGARAPAVPCIRQPRRSSAWCRPVARTPAVGVAEAACVEVDITLEGEPTAVAGSQVHAILESLREDAARAVEAALQLERGAGPAGPVELSVVLASDARMAQLNQTWRGKEGPTDVLSFPMGADSKPPEGFPLHVLGDLIISLDTAQRQADERGYGLLDECRVLLVHGLLHLLGHDHETGQAGADAMAAAELKLLRTLGWEGQGLIGAAEAVTESLLGTPDGSEVTTSRLQSLTPESSEELASTSAPGDTGIPAEAESMSQSRRRRTRDIKLICIDMDGTLLDSSSRVLPSSAQALRAALAAGVLVCLATGKARPAAMAAMGPVGLAGHGLVVSNGGPGIFLQGLATYGREGNLLPGKNLPPGVVREAFQYSLSQNAPLCGFLGDTCVTLRMTDELMELHTVYYEPLAGVAASVEDILCGPPVKKLLFMTDAGRVDAELRPHWRDAVQGKGAEVMQAVPTMLELVPSGVNKWVGLQALLPDLALTSEEVMAIGDGGNDLHIVANVGVGVAMDNAVPEVKEAAAVIVASNDEGGVAEAIERYIL